MNRRLGQILLHSVLILILGLTLMPLVFVIIGFFLLFGIGIAYLVLTIIGAIKANIGHLEAGAGIMGLIKVLLQLQHGMLLPTITSEEPSDVVSNSCVR